MNLNALIAKIARPILLGAKGSIPYIDTNGLLRMLNIGSTGQVLTEASGLPSWAASAGTGDLLAANNLSDVNDVPTAHNNLSAMDAGRRSVSLRALGRIADVLGCSPSELLERDSSAERPVFRPASVNARVRMRDAALIDGSERTWVHTVLLAWQRHYHTHR